MAKDNEKYEGEYFTLTDEDGKELTFELLGSLELDGTEYYALVPEENEKGKKESEEVEYVILKKEIDEDGEELLVTIDDDDEFDKVADIFEDELFDEIDLDE